MLAFLANTFGYVLNFFYNMIGNYGIAIILFCIAVKVVMIPLSIKQQKSQKKSQKLQSEMKQIQFKYKNDPEKMNQATMELYKREKMSPFSGCLVAIIQMILLISVFYMVREPLTYMKKLQPDQIDKYVNVLKEEQLVPNQAYSQMAVISEANNIKSLKENNAELTEQQKKIADTFGDNLDSICTNMNIIGIDLSKVPTQSMSDFRVYIIPVLYVISSFASIKITTNTGKKKKEENKLITDGSEESEENYNPMQDASKTMTWIMPIMSISIAIIAPLGLALYWLMNNILSITERLVLNKILEKEEEAENV